MGHYSRGSTASPDRTPKNPEEQQQRRLGQDVLRVACTSRTLRIDHLTTSLAATANLDRAARTHEREAADVHRYLAISEMMLAQRHAYNPAVHDWLTSLLREKPYRRKIDPVESVCVEDN
ncbi:MAG TPA: hypothetical protein VGQ46_02335 [Thermoanaerobaculia bacterium]|nr:hypothetical protein [Thermoanaerobaculia bacterium]